MFPSQNADLKAKEAVVESMRRYTEDAKAYNRKTLEKAPHAIPSKRSN